ncbi:hypothetical protein C8R44DRAFT_866440 [Mycena epipterygia]|nr:hypothetical protein C8R44DRAFT_866440 [Mycena epipterygia]
MDPSLSLSGRPISQTEESSAAPFEPQSPFNDPAADAILHSSDGVDRDPHRTDTAAFSQPTLDKSSRCSADVGLIRPDTDAHPYTYGPIRQEISGLRYVHRTVRVDFRVYRVVLSLASPFFKDMFSLPQDDTQPAVPVIPMPETALVLDRLLRFWYPGAEPVPIETLDNLREILEILLFKYDTPFITSRGKELLRGFIGAHPVAVFSIACRHQWRDVALEAAQSSLKLPLRLFDLAPPVELKYTAADTYHRLLQYHSECAKVAAAVATKSDWATTTFRSQAWAICMTCDPSAVIIMSGNIRFTVREWFFVYMRDVAEHLTVQPGARVDDSKLMHAAVKKMAKCKVCRNDGFEHLRSFAAERLAPKVAEELAKVDLNLRF